MTAAEQSCEPLRDYSSPATWGDIEQLRHSLGTQIDTQIADVKTEVTDVKTQMAGLETRLETQIAEVQTQMTQLETRMERQLAGLETRLIRWSAGLAAAAGVAIIGFLVGILQAVD